MILLALVLLPVAGGLLALAARRRAPAVTMASLAAGLAVALGTYAARPGGGRIAEVDLAWIPSLGARIHLAMDGLSLVMVVLTFVVGLLAAASTVAEVRERPGLFHLCLGLCLTGVILVFLAFDLLVLLFAWELMLVPMFLLIRIWGHEERVRAALKFFVYTQAGGLLMLVAVLVLRAIHGRATGEWTFDYDALLGSSPGGAAGMWLFLGFVAAFAVKLPALPVHGWLPDAHTEAPTAGSIVLAGLMLKTGGYGLIRFAVPLFPAAAARAAPWLMGIGAAGVIWGALLAFGQTDLKRLVAYTSVSHLGFVLLGVFALDPAGEQGAVLQMLCHGLSTGGLFFLVGALQERLGTRDIGRMGGFFAGAPAMGGLAVVFALASLGLPGLGNFVAEILSLLGAFRAVPWIGVVATLGLVLSVGYSLRFTGRVFFGRPPESGGPRDLAAGEILWLGGAAALLLFLGLWPAPVIRLLAPALRVVAGG